MKNLNLKPGGRHPIGRVFGPLAIIAILLSGCGKSADEYIRQAQAELDADKIPAAIIDLKNALQKEPKNVTARVMLGQAYLDISDSGNAETDLLRAQADGAGAALVAKPLAQAELQLGKFDKAISYSEFPPDASASLKASLYGVRAMADLAQGKAAAADDAFAAGLKEDPHSVDLLVYMTQAAMAHRDIAGARVHLNQALAEAPTAPHVLSLNGAVTFAEGKYSDAEAVFAQVRKLQPWNLAALIDLAQAQLAQNKLKEADAGLEAVLKASPKAPRPNYLRAVTAYREKDYKTAQSHIQNVLGVAESSPPALLLAGAISFALDEFEQANSYLAKYVNLAPNDVQGRQLLAAAQMRLGRPADAVKTLSPAVGNSDNAQLLAMIGDAALRSGDAVGGEKYLTQALQKQPDNSVVRTELGLTKVSLGETDAAIEEFEKASKQDPNSVGADSALFATYVGSKDFDKALGVAQALQAKQPTNPMGFDYEAIAYFGKGDRDAGRKALAKAKELWPEDPMTLRLLAAAALQENKPDDAIGYYQTLAAANPRDALAAIGLAQLQASSGKPDMAEATLQKAMEQNPDSYTPSLALARLLLAERKSQDALTLATTTLAKNPRQPEILEVVSQAQLAVGQPDAAIATLKTLVDLQPSTSAAHRELSGAYVAAHNLDAALGEARKAVELAPDDKIAKLGLGQLLIASKNLDQARQSTDAWATASPRDADFAELQGMVALAQNRPQDAIDAFQRGMSAQDTNATRMRLALAQVRAGHASDGEKTLTSWLDANPKDAVARNGLAQLYMDEKKFALARDQFAEIFRQAPDNAAAENNLAWTMSLLGQDDEALQHAQHAAAAAPNTAGILDTLGVIQLKAGQMKEARETLEKSATAAPNAPSIQFHFAQVLAQTGEKNRAGDILRRVLDNQQSFDERDAAQKLLKDISG